ncbi:MAG: hypothetical protein QE263_06715 [Vampirovibrionales bacterium]|nr:hypothetical protein [Vampirovibrionales bacterium]
MFRPIGIATPTVYTSHVTFGAKQKTFNQVVSAAKELNPDIYDLKELYNRLSDASLDENHGERAKRVLKDWDALRESDKPSDGEENPGLPTL